MIPVKHISDLLLIIIFITIIIISSCKSTRIKIREYLELLKDYSYTKGKKLHSSTENPRENMLWDNLLLIDGKIIDYIDKAAKKANTEYIILANDHDVPDFGWIAENGPVLKLSLIHI
jgi:hypothetical protein